MQMCIGFGIAREQVLEQRIVIEEEKLYRVEVLALLVLTASFRNIRIAFNSPTILLDLFS